MPYKEAHDIIHCYKYSRMRTPGHVIYVGVDICRVVSSCVMECYESDFNTITLSITITFMLHHNNMKLSGIKM